MSKKISNLARQGQYQDKYKRKFPYQWFRYCREPLENIEGWDEMLNDTSGQRWHLHHRAEIPDDGVVVSRESLKRSGLYFALPANKLIFMTESEHRSLHNTGENNPFYGKEMTGELNPMYGRNKYDISEEELQKLYVDQGLTQQEIAEKVGCCQAWICKKLKEFGISRK